MKNLSDDPRAKYITVKQVTLEFFKRFKVETFELSDNIILAGPNNTGKSTLLEAIAVWNLVLQKWLEQRGPESGSRAKKRTGVAVTRQEFTTIPLREMNLLWSDRSTGLRKEELANRQKLGTPRILKIGLQGIFEEENWELTFEFTYRYPELIYVKPTSFPDDNVLRAVNELSVVHVPPFSGIGVDETRYDKAYQDLLIGQGKPGDIIRNLLLEIYENKKQEAWDELKVSIGEIFGYELLPPVYSGQPFIVCEYRPGLTSSGETNLPRLDISSAGSGFLQVLMLLGFIYARPTSLLLLDEPDAHLHIILQKQIFDKLREVARERGTQLLIATHSEVFVDSTSPEQIISFFNHPHILLNASQRDQVREALKRLTSLDLLLAEIAPGILYVEDESDLNLLREWAKVLGHPTYEFLAKKPFWHPNKGRHPREAKGHFYALKAVKEDMKGILLLDGDNRNLADRELTNEGLEVIRWQRYEAESYLIHPGMLRRFVLGVHPDLFSTAAASNGEEYLREQLPPAVFRDPLGNNDYLNATPASKTLLPGFFEASKIDLTKNEYYQIASQMKPEEIVPEIAKKLDKIAAVFGLV